MDSPAAKGMKREIFRMLYHGIKQQVVEGMEKMDEEMEEKGADDENDIQKKKFKDIWNNANLLKHVAPLAVIAHAITNTPDALLSMTKMEPESFCIQPLNSAAQKWFDSTSTMMSFESKNDDDDLEEDTCKTGKTKAESTKKKLKRREVKQQAQNKRRRNAATTTIITMMTSMILQTMKAALMVLLQPQTKQVRVREKRMSP